MVRAEVWGFGKRLPALPLVMLSLAGRNRGSERVSNLPEVLALINDEARN